MSSLDLEFPSIPSPQHSDEPEPVFSLDDISAEDDTVLADKEASRENTIAPTSAAIPQFPWGPFCTAKFLTPFNSYALCTLYQSDPSFLPNKLGSR